MGAISDVRQEIFGEDYTPVDASFELGGYAGRMSSEEAQAMVDRALANLKNAQDQGMSDDVINEYIRALNHAEDTYREVTRDFSFNQFKDEQARGQQVRDEFMGRADAEMARGQEIGNAQRNMGETLGNAQRNMGETLGNAQRDAGAAGMGAAISYGNQQEARGIAAQNQFNAMAGGLGEAAFNYGARNTPGIDLAQSAIDEGRQSRALQALRDFYQQGPGPSLAQAQLESEAQRIARRNLSLAKSGRGSGVSGAAMQQALDANVGLLGDTNRAAAMLRAQEANDYRGQVLNAMGLEQNVLGNMRGMTLSEQQARASQALAGMQANDAAAAQARSQMINAAQAGAEAGVNFSGASNQARGQGFDYNTGMTNAGNSIQSSLVNAGNSVQSNLVNAGNTFETNATSQSNNQAETAERADQAHRDAGMRYLEDQLNADIQKEGFKAGVSANAQAANERVGSAMAASSAELISNAAAASDRETKQELERTRGQLAEALGQLRSMGGAAYPAVRQPDTAALDKSAARALGAAPAYAYRYTPEAQRDLGSAAPPGRRAGPMADDLKKGPLRDLVFRGPTGADMVDTPGLTMATAGAVGEQQRELQRQRQELDQLRAMATRGFDERAVYPKPRMPAYDFGY